MARTMLLLYAAMCAAAVLLQLAFGGSLRDLVAPGGLCPGPVQRDVAVGIGLGLATVLLSRLASRRMRWARQLDEVLRELLRPLSPRDVPAQAIMSAVAEELLFRGFLQPRLGLVITALLFGLAHPRRVSWMVLGALMGFAFGWLVQWTGTLVAPVLAHFVINHFNMHALLEPRAEVAP